MSDNNKVKILFPVDFSEHTENCMPMAEYLAKIYDAEIHLLHVLEAPTGPMRLFSNYNVDDARQKALNMMEEVIKNAEGGVEFRKVVKEGRPYRKIIEATRELNVNAIIMGTHGANGVRELMVGTNAARVVRTAPCPVITIRKKPGKVGFSKILLPLDLSKETGEKLKLGVEFAQNFGADLQILSVLEHDDEDSRRRMKRRMSMARNHVIKQNIQVETATLVAKGNIADTVLKHAEDSGIDLICIMTQQELDFKETFLGSNASHIVNHSDIPVVAIKPEREYAETRYVGSHFG